MSNPSVGVDVGGTFTDVVTVADGDLAVTKAPSNPDAPEEGVLDALDRAADTEGLSLPAIDSLVHGTTVATNAVLEGTWANAALVTTEGFRDVLEIGRQDRPELYDLTASKPDPIVPRDRRFEVPERLDERGEVRTPLDDSAVEAVANEIATAGSTAGGSDVAAGGGDVESVAVCLLFAYENDAHERRVAEVLRERLEDRSGRAGTGGDRSVPVTISADVLPELREYERTLATALNAALLPVMSEYVETLADGVANRGCEAPLEIMTSGGGLVGTEHARDRPVETLLSGPAAGVQGAAYVAGLRDTDDAITMDMGGTSCDVSLITGGEPTVTTERTVGDYAVAVPAVDVHTIGAGGGSIAWLDDGGALRVGPRSAGAEPGPVCYGRGGAAPTVTDAQLLLGRLDPGSLIVEDGADRGAVEEAMRSHVAGPMDSSVEAAARGVLEVANANMERALRVVSVERGHDPRQFDLVAYGGAGPLHATALADSLEIPRVLVPRTAGALSALGLLSTDRLHSLSTSMVRPLADVEPATVADVLAALEAEGRSRFDAGDRDADGGSTDPLVVERRLDLRYVGQASELTVELPGGGGSADRTEGGAPIDDDALAAAADRFHDAHEQRFGHAARDEPVELVTVRVRVREPIEAPTLRPPTTASDDPDDAIVEERPVAFGEDWHDAPIYDRELLPAESSFAGPAIVEGPESTVTIRPGQTATVDEHGTIVVEVGT
ncbi:N-methylhydantoinase A/acetone carboxylase, beta subunit [Salinarchaeum sp. Harcht-Bsk1]|uniref:hydantoinase/oxoprolinase family protein n=1 Tax=Salinarchaeum sp. Harcht-Bsk1 TaxID=1333523 RepID=UPI0003423FCC|nr:hydantoinase/oxoprolinase family protein [Salinarchaeum sp. Harcht-Bsk1]AGN01902.1 N-methylhydantoinase A/acetone carboxylase, beta subunit [Salinarchaeum sp. Harcht-Bsk1]